ncbi:MAG TPA: GDSL-type esterase/lipase family protein [Niastella sp.]|nr:GDSL-type esterase/lipase family protein [Niastella sp.]
MKTFLILLALLPVALQAQLIAVSDKQLNIFTLGDSNGTFPNSWPNQLQLAFPNAQVFNVSKSGRTIGFVNNGDSSLNSLLVIEENLCNASEYTKDRPYDFIVLELGTNDGKAVFSDRQDQVPGNLDKLIKTIKRSSYPAFRKARIIIVSPPPYGTKAEATEKYKGGGARVESMSKTFKKVALQNGCLFVNGYTTPGLDINTMTPDGLHLDGTASRKLMEPVIAIMKK